ncbi:DUF6089 family protein [Bergeyella sp. RCAD1439]|uniref:DUF6089 family protein n=1 Tax=Bergeyella anatis TaxID=3113737 RepID=UPI002E18AFD9|nr:DUF6089 family protein [Bergeyella sp. RCAD1439]
MSLKSVFLLSFTFVFSWIGAQRHELGARLGMSHLVGDVGRTNYVLQKPFGTQFSKYGFPFYGGLTYRYNFNPYQSIRFDLGTSYVQFDDQYAQEDYRRNRRLFGNKSGEEAKVLFEYNFFPINEEQKGMLSPYVFGGFGGLRYYVPQITFVNDFQRDANGVILPPDAQGVYAFTTTAEETLTKRFVMAVPFGAGLKYKMAYNWVVSLEMMFQPTFSDNLDYSTVEHKDVRFTYNRELTQPGSTKSLLQQEPYMETARNRANAYLETRRVGNLKSMDWINNVTLGVSYSFGRPPCYCN